MAARYEAAIPGLNRLLRDLKQLPKEYQAELRDASTRIAAQHMVPAWRAAAMSAGPWGPKLADTIRPRRDRIPAIVIGRNRRMYSGGATGTMVRYPSHAGTVRPEIPKAFTATGWMQEAKPAYIGPAVQEWADAVSRTCLRFNLGPSYG